MGIYASLAARHLTNIYCIFLCYIYFLLANKFLSLSDVEGLLMGARNAVNGKPNWRRYNIFIHVRLVTKTKTENYISEERKVRVLYMSGDIFTTRWHDT